MSIGMREGITGFDDFVFQDLSKANFVFCFLFFVCIMLGKVDERVRVGEKKKKEVKCGR